MKDIFHVCPSRFQDHEAGARDCNLIEVVEDEEQYWALRNRTELWSEAKVLTGVVKPDAAWRAMSRKRKRGDEQGPDSGPDPGPSRAKQRRLEYAKDMVESLGGLREAVLKDVNYLERDEPGSDRLRPAVQRALETFRTLLGVFSRGPNAHLVEDEVQHLHRRLPDLERAVEAALGRDGEKEEARALRDRIRAIEEQVRKVRGQSLLCICIACIV